MSPNRPVAAIAHLSGRYRGKIQHLAGDALRIGVHDDAEIRFSTDDLTPWLSELPAHGPYAVLERSGDTYELRAAPEADIWVNGRRAERRALQSGDVLEIGEGGPVLRFRLYPAGSPAYKTVSEVFADCAQCIRHSRTTADRAGLLLGAPPRELLTRTAPVTRGLTLAVIVILVAAVAVLWSRGRTLERQLAEEVLHVRGLTEVLERSGMEAPSAGDVRRLRETLFEGLARIDALEERTGARGRVIERSAGSVVFVQGSWGFEDARGRALRFAGVGPDGSPRAGPGGPDVTLEGNGPPVEIFFTGTAFVVGGDGQLLTNRHVALPWDYTSPATLLTSQGLVPRMIRLIGYVPGEPEPFDLALIRASDTLDVALLDCERLLAEVPPLELARSVPRPGDDVIVMGYPLGISALLARADPEAVAEIQSDESLDFWGIGRRLAAAGLVQPLATAGVVGQVTSSSVVYDAETTHGGSGGPVLDLDGRVLAVNAAILPQFGGSNLGVPAAEALELLRASD